MFGRYYKLDFQTNKVFLIENNTLTPVCIGYYDNNIWCFKVGGLIRKHEDPFVAAIKLLL